MENYKDMITDLVEKISEGQLVPIIGTGAYEVVDDRTLYGIACKEMTVSQYAIYSILDKENVDLETLSKDDNEILRMGSFQGMNALRKILKARELNIVQQLKIFFKNSAQHIRLNPQVNELLVRGNFPLILSTCPFNYLENEILESGKRYKVVTYQGVKDANQDIPRGDFPPTIFYLFNTVDKKENVVITDNYLLQFMHHYCDTATCPSNLISYLRNKNILSLGCDIPDWTVRFLLSSLKHNDVTKNCNGVARDSFSGAIMPVIKEKDKGLAMFLSRISYFSYSNITDFVRMVNSHDDLPKLQTKPKIFLSISSEEYDKIGVKVVDKLKSRFNVWLFKFDGDIQYWRKIKSAIEESDYFMPVITDKTINKVSLNNEWYDDPSEAQDRSKGLITEWQWALAKKKDNNITYNYCIPLAIDTSYDDFKTIVNRVDTENRYIRPLFFPKEGVQALTVGDVDQLTPDMVSNYINSEK